MSQPLPTSALRFVDLFLESLAALMSRPSRTVLTGLGTVLGVGTLVAILGLTTTARGQISARFDALAATTVTVSDQRAPGVPPVFSPHTTQRVLDQVNGVTAAGHYWSLPPDHSSVSMADGSGEATGVDAYAASPGLFDVMVAHVTTGVVYDEVLDEAAAPVAVVGAVAASRLNLPDLSLRPAVLIGGQPYVVVGIIDDVARLPELLTSVMIPTGAAEQRFGDPASGRGGATMVLVTEPGAATQSATEVRWALAPTHPDSVEITPPPDPRSLRESVGADLTTLLVVLGGICLAIGAIGIANTTLVAVMERIGEIGLRRSLGARRRHIFAQIVCESGLIGILGGLVGSTVGIVAVLLVSLGQGWAPILDPTHALGAPVLGLVIGATAGLYPSWQASRITPNAALRR